MKQFLKRLFFHKNEQPEWMTAMTKDVLTYVTERIQELILR